VRKQKLLVVAAVALVAFFVFMLWPQSSRITYEGFNRIEGGMSRADVKSILGPPGDFRTRPTRGASVTVGGVSMSPLAVEKYDDLHTFDRAEALEAQITETTEEWWSDSVFISVLYSRAGSVVQASCWNLDSPKQSPFDNLVWRAERQWRKWFPE
jgi:hypothetical protein